MMLCGVKSVEFRGEIRFCENGFKPICCWFIMRFNLNKKVQTWEKILKDRYYIQINVLAPILRNLEKSTYERELRVLNSSKNRQGFLYFGLFN